MSGILTMIFGEKCPRCGRRLHREARLFHDMLHRELDANHALQRRCQEMLRKP